MSYIRIREVPADEVNVRDLQAAASAMRTFETDSESITAASHLLDVLDNLDDETVIVVTKVVM